MTQVYYVQRDKVVRLFAVEKKLHWNARVILYRMDGTAYGIGTYGSDTHSTLGDAYSELIHITKLRIEHHRRETELLQNKVFDLIRDKALSVVEKE